MGRRDAITGPDRAALSTVIARRAISIAERTSPRAIAAYLPIRSEVDPAPVIAWAHDRGIPVALPTVLDAATIVFRAHVRGGALEPGRFGTRAPAAYAAEASPDLLILPMVAFDRSGARLGHGRGFYDRAVAALISQGVKPVLVGVAFAVQEVPSIPVEGHDIRMDWIVTENETLHFPQ
jgi:5-formyltetrahydrofolate cyclo-ligase